MSAGVPTAMRKAGLSVPPGWSVNSCGVWVGPHNIRVLGHGACVVQGDDEVAKVEMHRGKGGGSRAAGDHLPVRRGRPPAERKDPLKHAVNVLMRNKDAILGQAKLVKKLSKLLAMHQRGLPERPSPRSPQRPRASEDDMSESE